jgi:large subunit ribosomal protein L25
MDQVQVHAEPRAVTGKKVKVLRRQGLVPLVVYGREEPRNIQAAEFDTKRAISRAGGQLMELTIEGERGSRMVLARDAQYDVLSGALLHADLYEVDMAEKLQVDVSLTIVGESKLVQTNEAMVLQVLNEVQIECLPGDILQSIEVDVSGLEDFGDALYVRDLSLPETVEILTPEDELIVRLQAIQIEEEEEEEEEVLFGEVEPGEVEVIQRGRAEEEEEEE